MKIMLSILLTGILTENFILAKFLGICPFLGVSKKLNTAVGMSAAVIFVMLLSTAVTYPINAKLLVPNDLEYLQTIVFILVIAALVQLVEIILKKYMPALYNALGIYLPLITTNCAVLGVVLINVENNYNFGQSMMRSLHARHGHVRGRQRAPRELRRAEIPSGSAHNAHCRIAHLGLLPRILGRCRRHIRLRKDGIICILL